MMEEEGVGWNKLDDVKPTSNGRYFVCLSEPYDLNMGIAIKYWHNNSFDFNGGGNEILFWMELPELPEVSKEFRYKKVMK